MITFRFDTPAQVGTLTHPVTVSAVAITSIWFSSTPELAPLGAAELQIQLTDASSGTPGGWQQTVDYQDSSVLAFFAQVAPAEPGGETVESVMARLTFQKLVQDGKLPSGTLMQSTPGSDPESLGHLAPGV